MMKIYGYAGIGLIIGFKYQFNFKLKLKFEIHRICSILKCKIIIKEQFYLKTIAFQNVVNLLEYILTENVF